MYRYPSSGGSRVDEGSKHAGKQPGKPQNIPLVSEQLLDLGVLGGGLPVEHVNGRRLDLHPVRWEEGMGEEGGGGGVRGIEKMA